MPYAVQKQEEAKKGHGIEEDEEEAREFFFISTLPWVSYTSLTQPVPTPADSNPRITWGKYSKKDGAGYPSCIRALQSRFGGWASYWQIL